MTEQNESVAIVKVNPQIDLAVITLYEESCKLLNYAETRKITTVEDLKATVNDTAIISRLKRAIEDKRKEYTVPINDHLKAINAAFQEYTAPLVQADQINRQKQTVYKDEQDAIVAEQERINAMRLEAAQAEMKLKGELTESVDLIEVQPAAPSIIRTDLGTSSYVNRWKAEVVDFALLPDEYKLPNMPMLNSAARSYKDQRTIPGVRIYNEPDIRMSAR